MSGDIDVLVVEDNYLNQKLFRDIFAINDITTQLCSDSDQAIKWLVNNSATKVAVIDIGLPGAMNGLELISYIRHRDQWQQLKIIAATAYSSTEDKKKIIAAGANYFLPKPLNIKKLVELVRYLLQEDEVTTAKAYALAEGESHDW